MRNDAAHFIRLVILIVAAVLATTTLTGCAVLDQRDTNQDGVVDRDEAIDWYRSKLELAQSVNTEYTGFVDTLTAQIAELNDAIGMSQPGSSEQRDLLDARDRLVEWRDKAQGIADSASSSITRFTDLIENMPTDWTNAGGVDGAVIGEGVRTIAPLLPPPFNAIAIGLAGLAPVLGKKLYDMRNERNTLIYATDEIKRTDPAFAAALDANTDKMRAIQGMKLARKVDKIRAPVVEKKPEIPSQS